MKKALLSVLIFMFLISTTLVMANAEYDSCVNHQHETEMLVQLTDTAVIYKQSPPNVEPLFYGNCVQCYIEGRGYSWLYTVCLAEGRVDGIDYHTVSGETCKITYLVSRGVVTCLECGHTPETLGDHDCFVVHDTCGYGTNDICRMDIS